MNEEKTYYQQRLPDLIDKLKSQVQKNFAIIERVVESDITSDKYFNVLKGRRIAAENSLKTMQQIDKLEQKLSAIDQEGYYKMHLPEFIAHLKQMIDLNLEIVDLDIDDEETFDIREDVGEEIKEIFGPELAKRIFKAIKPSEKLSEDKFHQVLKARQTASEDTEWALNTIDVLENELKGNTEVDLKKSWAKIAAHT